MVPLQNGKTLIGGKFTIVNGLKRQYLARLHADGSLDTDFNPDLGKLGFVYAAREQADGRVLIGGDFTHVNSHKNCRVARLNEDGSPDADFSVGAGPDKTVRVLEILPDNKIIIGGEFESIDHVSQRFIGRLHQSGSIDSSFVKLNHHAQPASQSGSA